MATDVIQLNQSYLLYSSDLRPQLLPQPSIFVKTLNIILIYGDVNTADCSTYPICTVHFCWQNVCHDRDADAFPEDLPPLADVHLHG